MAYPFARTLSRIFKRNGIEAGGGGRRWTGAPMLSAPAASVLSARVPAQQRARGSYINAPYGNRAVEVWTSTICGKGWQVRSQHPDAGVRSWLGDGFEGLIYPILAPLVRALVRDGEALIRLSWTDEGMRLIHLQPEQLDASKHGDTEGGGRIEAGVELDAADRIVVYHILPEAAGYHPPHRIPAADVLHIFDRLFPGQVRGISWLAPVLLKMRDRDEASDALLMQLKTAALLTGYIRDVEGGAAATAKDFRPRSSIALTGGPKLERVPEAAEYKYGTMSTGAEAYKIDTFGRIYAISRQALINDDLGALRAIPARLGAAARDFEAEFLVGMVEGNPKMSDGKSVFDASHGNLASTSAISTTSLSAARLAMRRQKGIGGEVIDVAPRFLLVPPELETVAEQTLATIAATTTAEANPFSTLSLIVEPRLTSATRWYLVADPATADGLEYAYLEGAQGPQTDTRNGFEVDGVEVKIRLDFGAGWIDFRGWQRNG